MDGWIVNSLHRLVLSKYDEGLWSNLADKARTREDGTEVADFSHVDVIDRIINCVSELFEVSRSDCLAQLAPYFIELAESYDLEATLKCHCNSWREWFHSICEGSWLSRCVCPQTGGRPPFFKVDTSNGVEGKFILHYYGARDFGSLALAICKEITTRYFNVQLYASIHTVGQHGAYFHSAWRVDVVEMEHVGSSSGKRGLQQLTAESEMSRVKRNKPNAHDHQFATPVCPVQKGSSSSSKPLSMHASPSDGIDLPAQYFMQVLPYHIVVDQQLRILQMGNEMKGFFESQGIQQFHLDAIGNYFSIIPEDCDWQWSTIMGLHNSRIALAPKLPGYSFHFAGDVIMLNNSVHGQSTAALMLNPQISSFEELSTTGIPFAKLPKPHRELLVTNDTLRKELAHALESSRLNESLSIQSKRTEEALRTKQVFVRYVSHEIRTPLNIANLGLQYLHKELDKMKVLSTTPAIRETLDEVKVSSSIAVEILNDLLLYEKIDDGIFKLAFSTCSVSALIEEAEKLFHVQAKNSNVRFEMDKDDVVATCIHCDKTKFQQVLRNLVSNAFKFTPTNGVVKLGCWEFFPNTMTLDVDIDSNKENMEPWRFVNGNRIHFAHDQGSLSDRVNAATDKPHQRRLSGGAPAVPVLSAPSSEVTTPITSVAMLLQQQTSISSMPTPSLAVSRTNSAVMSNSAINLRHASIISDESLTSSDSHSSSSSGKSTTKCAEITEAQQPSIPNLRDKSARDNAFVRIMVTDSGPGIHPSDQVNLFHQFAQVRPEELQQGQGSGLGLWIAANLVHMHGGRIGVVSAGEGQGSSFLFDLPLLTDGGVPLLVKPDPSSVAMDTADDHGCNDITFADLPKQQCFATVPLSQARILIVDDSPTNRKMMRRILGDTFQWIHEAENGQRAVEMYQQAQKEGQPYHIVMMDLLMPVMNGLDATKRIRESETRPIENNENEGEDSSSSPELVSADPLAQDDGCFRSLIVGVTGNAEGNDHDAFVKAGADSVLMKPVRMEIIMAYISNHFQPLQE